MLTVHRKLAFCHFLVIRCLSSDSFCQTRIMERKSARNKLRDEMKQEELRSYSLVRSAQLAKTFFELTAFHEFKRNGLHAKIEHHEVGDIDQKTLAWILDLEKRNMESVYNSCAWGWKEKKKIMEMTEPEARYLIARAEGTPVAFAHFRFDVDYGDPVLYCYELQLEASARRKGLGKFLMQILELMAFKNHMAKVVLTVLKHNKPAVEFFSSLKYFRDETNPVENVYEEIPYEILSKLNRRIIN